MKQIENVRYKRATGVQADSRNSAKFYFDLPATDGTLDKVEKQNPTQAMFELFSYKGAVAYATANGIEFPGAT